MEQKKARMKDIEAFTKELADLSDEDHKKCSKHLATCSCEVCYKFNRYLHFRDVIMAWEGRKRS